MVAPLAPLSWIDVDLPSTPSTPAATPDGQEGRGLVRIVRAGGLRRVRAVIVDENSEAEPVPHDLAEHAVVVGPRG